MQSGLLTMQLTLSDQQQTLLIDYLHLLQHWNKTYNLTAITDFEKMITHHLLDSLSISPYLTGENIVDVGSGAGLPGIPLAVYFPDKKFTLIDSIGKKVRFMNQVVRELALQNVVVVEARAEEYPTQHAFDTMIARAVGSIDVLVRIAWHLLCQNGTLLMMKSEVSPAEIIFPHRMITLTVPGIAAKRSLIMAQRDESWQK